LFEVIAKMFAVKTKRPSSAIVHDFSMFADTHVWFNGLTSASGAAWWCRKNALLFDDHLLVLDMG